MTLNGPWSRLLGVAAGLSNTGRDMQDYICRIHDYHGGRSEWQEVKASSHIQAAALVLEPRVYKIEVLLLDDGQSFEYVADLRACERVR
jgi:hypothetical protein